MQPGTRLGHYKILSAIGKGGMGEVWKAQDTRLHREVAIKTLRPEYSQDTERLNRFKREAQLLASLNHVNIGAIFGLENFEDMQFLVLELVEGDTLADRLKNGAMTVDQAIDTAIQIAEALEAAHGQGVIHRDLKPENIKLRADGTVKVLDFGLAKLAESTHAGNPLPESSPMTATGAVLGTTPYMSPEQARGVPLDKRTDIWAFGAVLYEMLTGQMAFPGRDRTETMAAVIKSDVDWTVLPESLPPLIVAFLRRCLAKDPRNRVHDIADVRLALIGAYELPPSTTAADPGRGLSALSHRAGWLVAALAIAGVAAGIYWTGGPTFTRSDMTVRQLTFGHGNVGAARFAPDGQVIVYGAAWDDEPYRLYQTRLDGTQSRLIDLEPADLLALSKDGKLAVSLSRLGASGWLPRGVFAEVDLAGGSPRPRENEIVAVEWGPDGEVAALVRRLEGESVLEYPVGTIIHRGSVIGPPRVTADGGRICFQSEYNTLMSAAPGGPPQVVATPVPRINTCTWSPAGDEIWFTHSPLASTHENIEAVNLDGDRRVLAPFVSFMEIEDVSSDGRVLVAAGLIRYSVHGSPAPDQPERQLSVFGATRIVQLSADSQELLLVDDSRASQGGGSRGGSVFTRSLDGTPAVELGTGRPLAITHDGDTVAMLGDGTELRLLSSRSITLVPTGIGSPRTIELPIEMRFSDRNPTGINAWEFQSWEFSDDGQRLLIPYATEDGSDPRVWVHDFDQERTWPITAEGVTGPVVFSSDGQFVASNETDGLFIYPVDGGDRLEVPGGRDAGKLVRWSSDPNVIYFLEQDGAGATVYERNVVTGERGHLRDVRVPDPAGVTRFDLWLSRDGSAYAYTLDRWLTNLYVIENLQ